MRGDRFVHSFDCDDYFKGIMHIKTSQAIHFKYVQFMYVLNKIIKKKKKSTGVGCHCLLQNSMEALKKVKNRSRNSTSAYIPSRGEQGLEEVIVHHVHSSIISRAKRWKQPKCPSVEEWINSV